MASEQAQQQVVNGLLTAFNAAVEGVGYDISKPEPSGVFMEVALGLADRIVALHSLQNGALLAVEKGLIKAFKKAAGGIGCELKNPDNTERFAEQAFVLADKIVSLRNGQVPPEVDEGFIKAFNRLVPGISYNCYYPESSAKDSQRFAKMSLAIADRIMPPPSAPLEMHPEVQNAIRMVGSPAP